ncbi:MAG TPA: nucleoside transporter C-terminal domain-containing protein, partial [Gemmataceae bacterium]|nr:nucleoside transporter C-terminal domain-containing protein [Gemmataceae bacterium]
MISDAPEEPIIPAPAAAVPIAAPGTPMSWRLGIAGAIIAIGVIAYVLRDVVGLRGQAFAGVIFYIGLIAAFSTNLRLVNWRTIGWGIALQLVLALLVLKVDAVRTGFEVVGGAMTKFITFSNAGANFVFGNLSDGRPPEAGGTWSRLFTKDTYAFQFAFIALPPILFVSAFFTVLYHWGILQRFVRLLARVMVHLMGTSGAETLSVSANVFMGQTEAPLIVKPYVPRMTNSELFTLMVSGMAHISGGMMVVYISYGANAVSVLTTCVMACPASLYLAKLFLPETSTPETAGTLHTASEKSPYVNAIDAAASGTTVGLQLALNVAAMLIVFTAFVTMFDALLTGIKPTLIWAGLSANTLSSWPDELTLSTVFGWCFSPAAFLMGVELKDIAKVGTLLGSKLAVNEHFAYLLMKGWKATPDFMSARSYQLTAFALTG